MQSRIVSLPFQQRRQPTVGRADSTTVPVTHEAAPDKGLQRLSRQLYLYNITQPAVSCAERGSERSRANPQERLQHLAAGTAGAAAPQGAGYGAITDRAAG